MDPRGPQIHYTDGAGSPIQGAPSDALLTLLTSIAKSTGVLLRLRLAELGFDYGQAEILLGIDSFRVCTTAGMATLLGIRLSAATRIVQHLLKRGLVERIGKQWEGPQMTIGMTPAGAESRLRIEAMYRQLEKDLSEMLSSHEIQQMARHLATAERQIARQLNLPVGA